MMREQRVPPRPESDEAAHPQAARRRATNSPAKPNPSTANDAGSGTSEDAERVMPPDMEHPDGRTQTDSSVILTPEAKLLEMVTDNSE